jgi:hypothetical protein
MGYVSVATFAQMRSRSGDSLVLSESFWATNMRNHACNSRVYPLHFSDYTNHAKCIQYSKILVNFLWVLDTTNAANDFNNAHQFLIIAI